MATKTKAADPFLDEELESGGLGDDDLDGIIDLSDVPDSAGFELWPAGMYDAQVDDVEAGRSQRSNNPMLTWQFKARNAEGKERTFYYFTTLDEKGLPRVKQTIKRIDPEYDLSTFKPTLAGQHFSGKHCQIRLKIQTYEGERRNSVSAVMPAREGIDTFLD